MCSALPLLAIVVQVGQHFVKGVHLFPKVVEVTANDIDLLLQEVIGFGGPLTGVAFWTLGAWDAARALRALDAPPATRPASGASALRTVPGFRHLGALWSDVSIRQADGPSRFGGGILREVPG